jgi:hypothetical protein
VKVSNPVLFTPKKLFLKESVVCVML